MAVWDVSSAIANLRSLLGDGAADKFEFKTLVSPAPDSVTTRFFCGQTRLVPDTLEVYHNGVQASPSGAPDVVKGTFDYVVTGPSGSLAPSGQLEASYYYQWFTDAELAVFLDQGAQMLSLQATATSGFLQLLDGGEVISIEIDIGLQPTLLQFAAYTAYMRKATEWADSLTASAGGYTMDLSKRGPNWSSLARSALEMGKSNLDMYMNNPLSGKRPQLRFVTYTLPIWQNP